ncbi:MAG TPA: prolyl oligopeptidase family serine peptidase [Rhodanobacteraceae bacterium]|nr:prolyl oligopeptidase family serine peptidase [Rhodanobacteraceae bacterium]
MKLSTNLLGAGALAAMAATAFAQQSAPPSAIEYPAAHQDNTVDTYFGVKVPAPYQWMEDLTSPELHKWVAAENSITNAYLAKIPVRGWIEQRLTRLWNYAKEGTPTRLQNGMLFFRRNSGLQNQNVAYVQASPSAKPRVLIDPNKLSPDGSVQLKFGAPSPDGKYYAYALSNGGSDWETLHVMNVASGRQLADVVHWAKFSGISWTNDNKGFFYSRYPKPPGGEKAISHAVVDQKLYYHKLGTPQADDKLIYARADLPHAGIGGSVSEDGRYLFVFLQNNTISRNELYYADLGHPGQPNLSAKVESLYTQNDAGYTPIGHVGGTLYLQTTRGAPRGKIVAAKFADPDPSHWRTVVPEARGVLAGASMADGDILADYQVVAKSRLELFDTDGKRLHTLPLPTLGTVRGVSARNDSGTVYYGFTSYLYPTTVYRYDVADGKTSVYFRPDVKFDPSLYQTKQVFYTSKDGTRVPMFIVARKGIKLDGSHPTVLYGYGGFDISVTPGFDPMIPVWLEMGGVYAVANMRGGGEYGEAWHHAGMLGKKQNVFDDFAWAAKYLIKQGYTSSKHIGIQGYSNGGLLTGASITERPKLFGAAYIGHGVLDMLRYQKFSGGAFWVPEYGSSDDKQAFQWLIRYSPLQNIHKGTCYPPMLITTSWDDDRVVPSHEFKFTASIQQAQGCDNPILLHTTASTSHTYMPTDKQIRQTADVWAFEAYSLGAKEPPVKQ